MPTSQRAIFALALLSLFALILGSPPPIAAQEADGQAPNEEAAERRLSPIEEQQAAFDAYFEALQQHPIYRHLREVSREQIQPQIEEWERENETQLTVTWNYAIDNLGGLSILTDSYGTVSLSGRTVPHTRPGTIEQQRPYTISYFGYGPNPIHDRSGALIQGGQLVPLTPDQFAKLNWLVAASISVQHPLNKPVIESLQVEQRPLAEVLRTIAAAQNLEHALDSRLDSELPIQLSIRNRSTSEALALLAMVANCRLQFLVDPYASGTSQRFPIVENYVARFRTAHDLAATPELAINFDAEADDVDSALSAYRVIIRHAAHGMASQRYIALLRQ